jgi:fructoselysine-6-P-deglycase FrlB-like protein
MTTPMAFLDAVRSQPVRLEQSRLAVTEALASTDLQPWRTGLLAVVAIGASSHAGHALVHRLRRAGRRAMNVDASELLIDGPATGLADSYIFVSEGGRSRETIAAAQSLRGGVARLGVSNARGAPLTEVVDALITMDHGADSRVYTVGYTATLQAFGLLGTSLEGGTEPADWASLPDLVASVLDDLSPQALRIAEALSDIGSTDVVGTGASRSSVAESALLIRESTRIPAATYDTYQYLHGPMESLGAHSACVLFGDGREVALAEYLAGVGVRTVLITSRSVEDRDRLLTMRLPPIPEAARPILQILPAQLMAAELARLRGLRIDGFLYHQDDTKIDALDQANQAG